MHSFGFLLLTLALCLPAMAQPICSEIFSGVVIDDHGAPVAGAAVVLFPGQMGQTTDESGQFKFNGLCAGIFTVKVQYLGYEDESFELRVATAVTRTIVLKELITQLDEVVIRHHDAAHTESATNFSEMSEKQLAEAAGKSLGEAMKEIPGVSTIQSGPGIFKPVIHGVHSQRVLILNNGIRQEGQQWGAEHAPEIDPAVASNVVVIKDASAIKYGADALGGTIVVNPAELPAEPGINGTLNSVFQSNGRSATLSGMIEGGIGKQGWGWRLQSSGKRSGDFSTPSYSLTNTGIKEFNFSAATGYHREKAGFDIYYSRFSTEIGILKGTAVSNLDDLISAMERTEPLYTSGFSYSISEPRQEVSHNLIKINGHLTTTRGEWRVQYGFQNNNRKEFDRRIGALSRLPAMDLKLNTQTIDVEWENLHRGAASFTIGVNAMVQDNENVPGTQRIPFIPNYLGANAGIFGVSKIHINTWTLDAGIRYDYRHYDVKGYDFKNSLYSSTFHFGNPSATIGATWKISTSQMLRFNLSSAWRPPHVAELYSLGTHQSAASIEYGLLLNDSTNEIMDFSDVNFNPEQAFKFVTTYSFNRLPWSLEVTPYANYILNYTYLRPTGLTRNSRGVYPYLRNTQTDALFLGGDITAHWQATRHIKASATASLLHASDVKSHDYLVFIPANRYNLMLRYEIPFLKAIRNLYVESKLNLVSRQTRAPRVVTVKEIRDDQSAGINPFEDDSSNFDFIAAPDGYFLLDLAFGFSFRTGKTQYDFRLASENTTNELYREYTNRFRYYADDRGRNITLSIKCIF